MAVSKLIRLLLFIFASITPSIIGGNDTPTPRSMTVIIDAAPSIVSYQGSSAQTHGRLVIAPMGRALGYVEPKNLNYTVHDHRKRTGHDVLDISPVYERQ